MIENARRQVFLVAAVAIAAVLLVWTKEARYGLDLRGGTQLIYEIDIEGAKQRNEIAEEADASTIIAEQLDIISDRIDPRGVLDAVITRHGERQFLIELPQVDKAEAEVIKGQIQNLGRLEMRIVEDGTFDEDGVTFDMAEEKKRVEAWLAAENNRQEIAVDPLKVRIFNSLSTSDGGPLSEHLHWYAAKVVPSFKDPDQWDSRYSKIPNYPPAQWVVDVFDDAQFDRGPPPETEDKQQPFLVELLPINMKERHFTGENMDASGVSKGNDPESGTPCVYYKLDSDNAGPYADWSSKYKGKPSAIILNDIVRSAPSFRGRIYGTGIITGGFTDQEAAALAKVIKTGSLKVKPSLISDKTIGATLGERSIQLGQISIAVGGLFVLIFILAYYRLAGLVAFSAIALNVFLILALVRFIEATITLPGIAGLVLTMGMAVDANILIYERIREEVRKGKDLLQAVRAGFDRAMVTVLDANITTFIAGVVLYNVGVGPVRGFAVTLMVGILTSLFTAFFVSRVAFHFLLVSNTLREFKVAGWFTGLKFDFVKMGRVAFTGSAVVIVLSIGNFIRTPSDQKYGLDFTGGASLELATNQAVTVESLQNKLRGDEAFRQNFPKPTLNTVNETDAEGRATQFSIKLKLTTALRNQIAADKAAAQSKGEPYEPPYKGQLRQILADDLVASAFSGVQSIPLPGGLNYLAQAEVHFTSPMKVADVRAAIEDRHGARNTAISALDDPELDTAKDISIEFPVNADTNKTEISDEIITAVKGLTDVAGEKVRLSDPIPNAEDIGPRMVGDLQTAAIGAMLIALFLIVMYIRVRFHEYKYALGAVAALLHDVLITLGFVVLFNSMGWVTAEIDLAMIAAFLTIIGYSINDTIVIFDRVRENVSEQARLGDTKETFAGILNRSINQTLSRTILTSGTTLFVVLAQFVVNRNSGSALEGFSFALIIGILCGTYSTMFIASPLVLWLRNRELAADAIGGGPGGGVAQDAKVPATSV